VIRDANLSHRSTRTAALVPILLLLLRLTGWAAWWLPRWLDRSPGRALRALTGPAADRIVPSMDAQLVVAVLLAIGFAVTNGLHDASNAIATLVATRAATPLQAILLASVFNLLGPLFLGAAVADTIGGIVAVPPDVTVEVIGAGLAAAVTWNLVTWRLGLPSSSGHALVGGLVGAAVVEGGVHAINWGESRTGGPSACSGS
jgi:hypothetical protein